MALILPWFVPVVDVSCTIAFCAGTVKLFGTKGHSCLERYAANLLCDYCCYNYYYYYYYHCYFIITTVIYYYYYQCYYYVMFQV